MSSTIWNRTPSSEANPRKSASLVEGRGRPVSSRTHSTAAAISRPGGGGGRAGAPEAPPAGRGDPRAGLPLVHPAQPPPARLDAPLHVDVLAPDHALDARCGGQFRDRGEDFRRVPALLAQDEPH